MEKHGTSTQCVNMHARTDTRPSRTTHTLASRFVRFQDHTSQQNYYTNAATEQSVWEPPYADLSQAIAGVNTALDEEWKMTWSAIKIQSTGCIVREHQCRHEMVAEKNVAW